MQLQSALRSYTHDKFLFHEQAMKAIAEFLKNIPGRILQVDIDPVKPVKAGFKKEESIYKYAVNPQTKTASLEYYEHRDQGAPTMGLYLNRVLPELNILGTKVQKRFSMTFTVENGEVVQNTKYED